LDEETKSLLKRILEGQAYRQLVLCNIRGHGVRFVPEVSAKLELARALNQSLEEFDQLQALYARLGHGDLVRAVRSKMDRVPYPASRLELAVCLYLCERVQHLALATFTESSCEELAAIARERLEASPWRELPADPAFLEFCADATNRPRAQELFNGWLAVTLLALGRPDSRADERAVELGLRSRRMSEVAHDFFAGLEVFLRASSLTLPDEATLGIALPIEESS
jgi:1,2-phenylacetyl-CoA epoxidase catalytic subunit